MIKPHAYIPSALHMGDCMMCGHLQDAPIHRFERHAEIEQLEMRVARYFDSAPDEPAGRLISDLLIALRRTL
jgi:hypothetical protein